MKLSNNFTLEEFTRSSAAVRYGLSNAPNPHQVDIIRRFVREVLQPFRDFMSRPIFITSGFRTVSVNRVVSGAANSYHLRGSAADIKISGLSSFQLAYYFNQWLLSTGQSAGHFEIITYSLERGGHLHIAKRSI